MPPLKIPCFAAPPVPFRHTCAARKDCRWEWTGRPQGIAACSGRAARTDCRLQWTGRPQGIAACSGRAARKGFHWKAGGPRPPGPPRPPGGGRGRACAPRHWPVRSPQPFHSAKHHPRHFPVVPEVSEVPAQAPVTRSGFAPFQPPARAFASRRSRPRRLSRAAASRLPCHWPAPLGLFQHRFFSRLAADVVDAPATRKPSAVPD